MKKNTKITLAILLTLLGCQAIGYQADIPQPNCTMNGLGQGSCQFTNRGNRSGALCGTINVIDNNNDKSVAMSNIFCSGNLDSNSTASIDFSIPSVQQECTPGEYTSWNDECRFEWIVDVNFVK